MKLQQPTDLMSLRDVLPYYCTKAGILDCLAVCFAMFVGVSATGSIWWGLVFATAVWIYGLTMMVTGIDRAHAKRDQRYRELDLHSGNLVDNSWENYFHECWGRAKESPDYSKDAWMHVQRYLGPRFGGMTPSQIAHLEQVLRQRSTIV